METLLTSMRCAAPKLLRNHLVMLPDAIMNEPVPNFQVSIAWHWEMVCEHLPLNVIVAALRVEVPDGIRGNLMCHGVFDEHEMSRKIIVHVILELIDAMLDSVWRWPFWKYQLERSIILPGVELDPRHGLEVVETGGNHDERRHRVVIVSALVRC